MKSTLVSMATGLGKTIICAELCKRWDRGRIMFLAHREELIFQAAEKIGRHLGEECDIEMADYMADQTSTPAKVVVASVQTLNARRNGRCRIARFRPDAFGLIVTDEAHHAPAASYRRIYDHFDGNPAMCHVGLTATPDRADEVALGNIFDSVAFEYNIRDGINDGWLVPIQQQFVQVSSIDLSDVKAHRNDLSLTDLGRIMRSEETVHGIVSPTIELAGDRQTLVFCASVDQAHRCEEVFNRHREGSSHTIDQSTPRIERREILTRFAAREFQYLCNMAVFTEGFDSPGVGCVAMARPTKSRALYAQAIGRGTRTLPNIVDGIATSDLRRESIAKSDKPDCLVLDFVGNAGSHKLICTADILGGNEIDAVVEEATRTAKDKSGRGMSVDMQEELEAAKLVVEEKARKKRFIVRADATYKLKAVDPFNVFDVISTRREAPWHKGRKPSERQLAALRKFGVPDKSLNDYSFTQASKTLDLIIGRMKENKCSYKQAKILKRFGYDVRNLGFTDASRLLDAVAKNGWKRPS